MDRPVHKSQMFVHLDDVNVLVWIMIEVDQGLKQCHWICALSGDVCMVEKKGWKMVCRIHHHLQGWEIHPGE